MKSLYQADSRSENQPQKLLHAPFFQVISHSSVLETLTPFPVEVVSSTWKVFFPIRSMLKYIMKSQNNLGWKGAKEVIQFNLLLKAGPTMRSDKPASSSLCSGLDKFTGQRLHKLTGYSGPLLIIITMKEQLLLFSCTLSHFNLFLSPLNF